MGTGRVTRREFLVAIGAGAVVVACSDDDTNSGSPRSDAATTTVTVPPAPALASTPFTLGVASGDPLPEAVVLWTRLAPDPINGGGMPPETVAVLWEIADDETFDTVVTSGIADATPDHAHSLHVDADGLDPDTWYHYRFRVGEWTSPIGRTRTAPEPDADVEELRFGFASCQHWERGFYNAYRDMAATDLDLVLFLGDYIYEGGPGAGARLHNSPEVTDLAGYRNRYGLYKGDANLQAAHARCPWIVIWDDHEVENDYAGAHSEDPVVTSEAFLTRRAAAYQAWWEHTPVRMDPPTGPDLEITRDLRYGTLAHLFMLDTRQYRDIQACGVDGISLEPACPEVNDPARTIVGADQEQWLLDGLRDSDTTWNVLGNQVVMTRLMVGEAVLNYDQWDGYAASRQHLYERLRSEGITNTVVVTGDIHLSGVGDLTDEQGVVATELVGTSIASVADLPEGVDQLVADNLADVKYFNSARRGWCHNVVTAEQWTAEFRAVEDNTVDGSATTVDATFTITPDRPGATRVG